MKESKTEVSYLDWLILSICDSNTRDLTWLMIGVYFFMEAILADVKILLYGQSFYHWIDLVGVVVLTAYFLHLNKLIGDEYMEETKADYAGAHTSRMLDKTTSKIKLSEDLEMLEQEMLDKYGNLDADPAAKVASMARCTAGMMLHLDAKNLDVVGPDYDISITITEK